MRELTGAGELLAVELVVSEAPHDFHPARDRELEPAKGKIDPLDDVAGDHRDISVDARRLPPGLAGDLGEMEVGDHPESHFLGLRNLGH